jgi:hypothetical protein
VSSQLNSGIGRSAIVRRWVNALVTAFGLAVLALSVQSALRSKFLILTKVISYESAGRNVLRWREVTHSHDQPLLVGAPDYDWPAASRHPSVAAAGVGHILRSGLRSESIAIAFDYLTHSPEEVNSLGAILGGSQVLTDANATEEAVKMAWAPRILHLSTHGFALQELSWPNGWFANQSWRTIADFQVFANDPMIRSGLALAGANARRSPKGWDDGILTANEASLLISAFLINPYKVMLGIK